MIRLAVDSSIFFFSFNLAAKMSIPVIDTDMVHQGYALAHEMDYFLTTDKALKHVDPYIPEKANLQVIGLEDAKTIV